MLRRLLIHTLYIPSAPTSADYLPQQDLYFKVFSFVSTVPQQQISFVCFIESWPEPKLYNA